MVGGVMTFAERAVREVMTPRTNLVAIPEDAPLDEIAAVFAQSGYSRLPVYRGTLDEIVGMLHAFDLFKLQPGDRLPIRPVANAPAGRNCGDLLLDMQRERRHLAVVLDEFGGTLGIVTFEDLLEELVGEIFDEFDEGAGGAGGATPTLFETDGATPISAIEERFDRKLPTATHQHRGRSARRAGGTDPRAGRSLHHPHPAVRRRPGLAHQGGAGADSSRASASCAAGSAHSPRIPGSESNRDWSSHSSG